MLLAFVRGKLNLIILRAAHLSGDVFIETNAHSNSATPLFCIANQ